MNSIGIPTAINRKNDFKLQKENNEKKELNEIKSEPQTYGNIKSDSISTSARRGYLPAAAIGFAAAGATAAIPGALISNSLLKSAVKIGTGAEMGAELAKLSIIAASYYIASAGAFSGGVASQVASSKTDGAIIGAAFGAVATAGGLALTGTKNINTATVATISALVVVPCAVAGYFATKEQ